MKAVANLLAVLLLALAPAALLSVMPARAQPFARQDRREERREAPRAVERRAQAAAGQGRMAEGGAYRGQAYPAPAAPPVYRAAPYAAPYSGGYAQRYPGYAVAPPPPAYAYAPPPGNSLGGAWGQQQDQARIGVRQGRLMPLGQVMLRLRRSTPGRILDAGLEPGPGGRAAYRVRWAAVGGRRIDFIVDAVTGEVLSRNGY
jgi:hypothetical protein